MDTRFALQFCLLAIAAVVTTDGTMDRILRPRFAPIVVAVLVLGCVALFIASWQRAVQHDASSEPEQNTNAPYPLVLIEESREVEPVEFKFERVATAATPTSSDADGDPTSKRAVISLVGPVNTTTEQSPAISEYNDVVGSNLGSVLLESGNEFGSTTEQVIEEDVIEKVRPSEPISRLQPDPTVAPIRPIHRPGGMFQPETRATSDTQSPTQDSIRRLPTAPVQQATPPRTRALPQRQFGAPPVAKRPAPVRRPAPNPAAMRAVANRVEELNQSGFTMAQRASFYSARADFIQALRMNAQALDAQSGGDDYSQALARGMRALDEATDFRPRGSRFEADIDVTNIVASHRTPIIKGRSLGVSPLAATQAYYTYAQSNLAACCGGQAAAANSLYGLGKVQVAIASGDTDDERMSEPRAMAYYQAAMIANPKHSLASNELGVSLARYGQYNEARRVLLQSLSANRNPETWHNLAVVHEQLNERDLARMARAEQQTMLKNRTASNNQAVQWVDPATFARTNPGPSAPTTARPQVTQPQKTQPQQLQAQIARQRPSNVPATAPKSPLASRIVAQQRSQVPQGAPKPPVSRDRIYSQQNTAGVPRPSQQVQPTNSRQAAGNPWWAWQ